jgi:NAD(P)H dehydrogenase (quinone)
MTKKNVFVIYYSTYGHTKKLAQEIIKGLESSGVNAKLFQVAETLPAEVLTKMHAPPKDESVPVITASQLPEADGIKFKISK